MRRIAVLLLALPAGICGNTTPLKLSEWRSTHRSLRTRLSDRRRKVYTGPVRRLDEYYNDDADADEDADANNVDDAAAVGDDKSDDDYSFHADELCYTYLLSFLEGITDAKDNCEGIQNAYVAAYCKSSATDDEGYTDDLDDHDDYFSDYNHFSCCESLKSHYDAYCENDELITNMHLLLIASVLLLCEMAKSLIKTNEIHWLPDAGGCILVGTLCGLFAHFSPNVTLDDLTFDEELFLCILLPPIIFEAALSVNKKEFRRRRLAILMFAVFGTILSTFTTGYMVHYSTSYLESATTLPLLDSFIFGALISSIDPVAILSVLTNLNLTEKDTIFIMVFGESLLNDGIAITLFKSLVAHYNGGKVNTDEILGAIADFLIVGFGSILIGLVCGFVALIYFWLLRKKLNAPMEVASFFLWAGIPYYICDEANLSGIVSIVTIGFFMDIYIAKPKEKETQHVNVHLMNTPHQVQPYSRAKNANLNTGLFFNSPNAFASPMHPTGEHYVDLGDSIPCNPENNQFSGKSPSGRSQYTLKSLRSLKSLRTLNMRELLLREERFRLSAEADRHIRFVAHLLAQLSENCIFVYLGLFLFSKNYVWEMPLCIISIVACLISRSIMVSVICFLVWHINMLRIWCGCYKPAHLTEEELDSDEPQVSRTAAALQDPKIQVVLVLAGLRGAVSLALVESVPIYNGVTGEGTNYKGQMKAMTSAAIIFTIFVIGGSSYYILRNLGIKSESTTDVAAENEGSLDTKKQQQLPSSWKVAPKPEQAFGRKNPPVPEFS